MMKTTRSGQTTIEYLMILATVLVVALIAIGLSLFFAQSSGDVLQSETNTYWSTQTPPPFRIQEMQGYYFSSGSPGNGEIALVFQNVDSKPAYLRNLVLEPNPGTDMELWGNHSTTGATAAYDLGPVGPGYVSSPGVNITFAPSEKKTLYLRVPYACSNSGSTSTDSTTQFYNNLTIYYDTPYFTQLSMKGIKVIQSKCNPI